MKKLILFFSALIIVAFFTACEQDSLISTDVTEDVMTEHSLELDPELAALINSEEESSEIEERCSHNGSMSYSKTGQSGYPGIYSGKYRVGANNNPFPPVNEVVDYRVRVFQKTNSGSWVVRTEKIVNNTRTLLWNTPMYYSTNGYSRYLHFYVQTRKNCGWRYLDSKTVAM